MLFLPFSSFLSQTFLTADCLQIVGSFLILNGTLNIFKFIESPVAVEEEFWEEELIADIWEEGSESLQGRRQFPAFLFAGI